MNKLTVGLAIIAVVAAFLLGRWPAQQRVDELEQRLAALSRDADAVRDRLATSEQGNRLCDIQDKLLMAIDIGEAKNFGDARLAASTFFDAVREEAKSDGHPSALDAMLAERDSVVVDLANADPAGVQRLRDMRASLREARSRPVSPESGPPAEVPL